MAEETPVVEPLTAEAVAKIVDSQINKFVHSSKTDLAKMKEQLTTFGSTIESLKVTPTTTPTENTNTQVTATSDPEIAVLKRTVKDLQTANQAALEKAAKADRNSALDKALAGFQFANDTSRDVAYKVFSSEMQTIGDGQYAIGDLPLADAVKARMAELPGLQAPKNIGGSGASSGRSVPAPSVDIKAGMKADEYNAIAAELAKFAP